jgi:hypothetical protein
MRWKRGDMTDEFKMSADVQNFTFACYFHHAPRFSMLPGLDPGRLSVQRLV